MRKLYRARKNKVFLGVCEGIGNYFRMDPVFIRLITIFICIFTLILPVVIVYFLCALIIPTEPLRHKTPHYRRLYRSRKNRKIAGICGGVGKFFKWDATFIRIFFVILLFITGLIPMVISYIAGWIIIPENPRKDSAIEIEIT